MQKAPVNVICMKWGTMYNGPYVNRLFSMVERHLTVPHRFVCFTDDNEGFVEGIESFPLPFSNLSGRRRPVTPWNKLSMFAPQLADLHGPTLYFDLDLLVVDNIDCFFDYKPGESVIIHDWLRLAKIEGNSSVFRFEVGKHPEILEYYLAHMEAVQANYRNDQAYFSEKLHEAGDLQYWPDSWVRSFKRHCLPAWPLNWFKTATVPPAAKVIVFHGDPKPDDAVRGKWSKGKWSKLRRIRPTPWVAECWR